MVHGLWGIENNPDAIRLVTVDEHHHVIKAGRRDNPQYDLKNNLAYRLEGVKKGAPADFRRDQNPTLDNKTADLQKVKVVIDVPYPREIHSVRRINTNGRKFFENDLPPTPAEISMVQVMVYDVDDPGTLQLRGSDWTPELNPDRRTVNLHLFAEPDKERIKTVPSDHFKTAFRRLGDAFGLAITPLISADMPPRLEEKIDGLDVRDTIALHELRPRPSVSPVNCDMIIFKNGGGRLR